jgi:hypothetical protein
MNLPVALAVGTGTRRLLRAARRRWGEQGGADFPRFVLFVSFVAVFAFAFFSQRSPRRGLYAHHNRGSHCLNHSRVIVTREGELKYRHEIRLRQDCSRFCVMRGEVFRGRVPGVQAKPYRA